MPRREAQNHILPLVQGRSPIDSASPSSRPSQDQNSTRQGSVDIELTRNDLAQRKRSTRDCFFKVIDVRTHGQGLKVQGECYNEDELDRFYDAIPAQEPDTIRVILDGRRFDASHLSQQEKTRPEENNTAEQCWHAISRFYLPKKCRLYPTKFHHKPIAPYSLPVLRKMELEDEPDVWYGGNSLAWHRDFCRLKPNDKHLYELQRYESTPVRFIVDRSVKDRLQVICFAFHAHVVDQPILGEGESCSSASWRWLEGVDLALSKPSCLPALADGDQAQTLRLLLINILSATVSRTVAFLEDMAYLDEFMDPFDPKQTRKVARPEYPGLVGGWALIYRKIEDDLMYLNSAMDCLLKRVRRHANSAADDPNTPLSRCLEEMTLDSEFYKQRATQKRIHYSEIFEVLSYRVNSRQADSVNWLTRLAALFLPMSLAAAILSMQSRFADLNLVLYDFVGVVIILGSIAFAASHIVKKGPDIYDSIMSLNYGERVTESIELTGWLKFYWFSIWWVAVLAAFLIGMLKDPVFGMKIFGFESAGITGTWIISLKGVRMAYDHYRVRESGKQQKEQVRFPGANVVSW